jgi:Zn-dependent metalloprotease
MNFSALLNSRCPYRPRPAVLGIALAVLSVSALASIQVKAPDRKRVEAAVAEVRGSAGVELATRNAMLNERGDTIVHANQTVQGHRVWGSQAVISTGRSGTRMTASSLHAGATPAGAPLLTQAQAIAIASKKMALRGAGAAPKSELIVFPTKYTGGVKFTVDPKTRRYRLDRANSVVGVHPKDAYVWAWEVEVYAHNGTDGVRDMKYVVDARTGALLRSDNGLRMLEATNPPIQTSTDVPAVATGYSQYNGTVTLTTTKHADGTYSMIDPTRGTGYNPYLNGGFLDWTGAPIYDANGNPISVHGMVVMAQTHEGTFNDFTWTDAFHFYDAHATNVWGDGQQFTMYPYGYEAKPNGETAAVDAMWAMTQTWDFYKNIFGRDGIDGQGTSIVAEVHSFGLGMYEYADYAAWNSLDQTIVLSDGTKNQGIDENDGSPIPGNPDGLSTLTALDVVGHEITHGVSDTAGLMDDGEAGEINEATSDFFGSMIEAYAKRAAGADSVVPEGNNWTIGEQVKTVPLRSMINPKMDGVSANNWYSGIEYLRVSYGSGAMNRFFYYLSHGAPSDNTDPGYSTYLPGGMAGIGNDKTARIWYKALTEYLGPIPTHADARVAAIQAATDLYGDGAELAAVKSAFAAINVGTVTDTPPVEIQFALVHPAGTLFNQDGTSAVARMPIVSMGTTVHLGADVQNTTDTSVTWKLGGMPGDWLNPGYQNVGGVVTADGDWTPDEVWGPHAMTVVSNADPLQFAEGAIWVVNGDADADNEFDAIDLGGVALSWGLNTYVTASHALVTDSGTSYGDYVDSWDVQVIDEAFVNAFGGI